MARKMVLVDPQMLQKPSQPIPDVLTDTLSDLDRDMKNILEMSSLPDHQKIVMYQNALQKYLHLVDKYKNRPTLVQMKDPVTTTAEPQVKSYDLSSLEQRAVESLPTSKRKKAEQLLRHLKDVSELRWGDGGELIVKDRLVPNTHITDLLNDIVRNRKSFPDPPGWREFSGVIRRANVPLEFVGNVDRRYWIQSQEEPARKQRKTTWEERP